MIMQLNTLSAAFHYKYFFFITLLTIAYISQMIERRFRIKSIGRYRAATLLLLCCTNRLMAAVPRTESFLGFNDGNAERG